MVGWVSEAFATLGIPPYASEREVRVAFRRVARARHPDRFPGDPEAQERFKQIVRAYEIALAIARGEQPSHRVGGTPRTTPPPRTDGPPPPPPRQRFACPSCDDTFAAGDACFRCAIPLVDTWRAAAPERPARVLDPRVDEMIARLERPPMPPLVELSIPPAARPWAAGAGFMTFAWGATTVGLAPLGVMLASFALFVCAAELHHRVRKSADARRYIF
jgi:hypothetical protein